MCGPHGFGANPVDNPMPGDRKRRQAPTFVAGERVQLVSTTDPYTELRPGARGTVALVDGLGTVCVHWDDGSTLGMVPGEDVIEHVVDDSTERGQEQ